jgi:peptidoglycan/LPS O-acetylase OafA/YrhL
MKRNASLDGVRAVAIALVISFHAFGEPKQGQLGVDLFFVLSGFLITSLLLEEWQRRGKVSFRAFYARRAVRLLPALLLMLVVVTPLLIAHSGVAKGLLWAAAGIGFSANLVMAHGSSYTPSLTPLWSLAQEEQFYLVWPPILVLLAARRGILASGLVAGIAFTTWRAIHLLHTGASSDRILYAPDTRSTGILVGCLAAIVLASPYRSSLARVANALAWPAFVALIGIPVLVDGREVFSGWLVAFALAAAIVLVAALDAGSLLARLLALAPLPYLGRISYSLYLWHLPILLLLGRGRGPAVELVGVAASVAVASISYRYVERPFLQRRAKRHPDGPKLAPAFGAAAS